MAKILDIDGKYRDDPDFPVAVVRTVTDANNKDSRDIVDPVFNHPVYNNLYGRLMTLIEATTDSNRLKAVKDVFSKELINWHDDVYQSARELAESGNSSNNVYTRGR